MKKIISLILLILLSLILVGQNTRTTVSSGLWSNSLIWDTGVPQTGDNVIINHNVSVDVGDTINDIIINANLTCNDTLFIVGVLNVESILTTNNIVYLINDDVNKGRFGLTTSGNVVGNFTWQKWIERCDGWGMYGGPFSTAISNYGFFHTGIVGSSYPNFWCNTYMYDETLPNLHQDSGWYKPTTSTTLNNTEGFMFFDSASSVTNAPRVIEMSGSIDLTQTIDFGLTYSGDANKTYNGWNLVSNPYPGTIDWDATGWFKTKMDDAIWVLDVCSGNYAVYAGGVGVNGGSRYISSGQGFWVKANKPNPELIGDRNILVDTDAELKSLNKEIIRVSLNSDEIAIVFNDSATSTYDTLHDAVKFVNYNSTLYTHLDSINYAINSINTIDTIPLYIRGEGIIEFNLENIDGSMDICYEDIETGEIYNMISEPSYSFISVETDFHHRFNIIFDLGDTTINEYDKDDMGELLMRVNSLGQEVNEYYTGIVIEIYERGTKRVLKLNNYE